MAGEDRKAVYSISNFTAERRFLSFPFAAERCGLRRVFEVEARPVQVSLKRRIYRLWPFFFSLGPVSKSFAREGGGGVYEN